MDVNWLASSTCCKGHSHFQDMLTTVMGRVAGCQEQRPTYTSLTSKLLLVTFIDHILCFRHWSEARHSLSFNPHYNLNEIGSGLVPI